MSSAFSVVAIIAAYNEADIIGQVVADLVAQDVGVYVLDDGSTDGTVAAVEPFRGRGVIGIERLAPAGAAGGAFDWERILHRKAEIAGDIDATWFIHHDADEFRESPWPNLSLKHAIERVDALGFNAIDFAGLDFWPTDDRFRPGDDVRAAFTFYSELAPYDRLQVRCWKKTRGVDLASSGGHEARFPDRRVFPLRFILRHYPIRGQAHGERKVFRERRNRFVACERERGWHVQYDHLHEGASFLKDPSTLTPFDADAVRAGLALRHRGVEALEEAIQVSRRQRDASQAEIRSRDAECCELRGRLADRTVEVAGLHAEAARLRDAIERHAGDAERWRAAVEGLARELDEHRRSLSWRWTAPARAAYRFMARTRS